MSETSDTERRLLRGLGRGGSLNLAGAVCQQACLFLTTAVVARVLGEDRLGRYVIVYAALTLGSLVSQLGLRTALTRFVAAHLAADEPASVRGLVRFAARVGLGAAVLLGLATALAARPLAGLFGDPDLAVGFVVVGAALPAFALRDLALAAVQGWRSQRAFALVGWVYEPLARLLLTVVAVVPGLGLSWGLGGAYAALLVAAWTAALAAAVALAGRLRALPPAPARDQAAVSPREVLGYSAATWGTTLTATGLIWADALLLGVLADPADVGRYTIAARLVGLAVFVLAPLDALFAPHFAHFHATGERSRLATTYAAAVTWSLRLSLPAFVLLIVVPRPFLSLFGPGYAAAAAVTVVLAVGQLVNAATGPAGSVLNMSGRVRLNLVDNAAGLLLNVVLNLVLIPPYGIVGAAVAWSATLVVLQGAKLVQVARLERARPWEPGAGKAVLATLVAAVVAVAVRGVADDGLIGLVVVGLAVYAAYGTATLALRLSPAERETLRGVLGGGLGR